MAAVWGALGIALLGCASKFVVDDGVDSGPVIVPVPDVGSPDIGPGPTPDAGVEADAPSVG